MYNSHFVLSICTVTVSSIWEQEKHHINSITGLSPISSCFCPVHKRKIHVRWSSRTKTTPSHHRFALFSDTAKSFILLAQSWSYWLLLPRGVGDTNSHPWGAEVSVLACFLTFFNQILIGCSHLLHYSQTVSCRSEKKSEYFMLWGCFSMLLE